MMHRAEADEEFGFEIYQGGPPKQPEIRVMRIGSRYTGYGGTHRDTTGQIGEIRIIRSSQVQDGVERLQIVAGGTAREHAREQERLLNESSEVLGVSPEDLPRSTRFFEHGNLSKENRVFEAETIRLRTDGGGQDSVEKDGVRYVVMEVEAEMKALMSMLGELTRDPSNPTRLCLEPGKEEEG